MPDAALRTELERLARAGLPETHIDNQIQVVRPQEQIIGLLELENIEFESGSARLTPRGRQIAERVRAVLARIPQQRVTVVGHTDNEGGARSNLRLSRQRAETVVGVLAETLDRNRFDIEAYGESRPIATNDTPAGRQRNRRIEFRIEENG